MYKNISHISGHQHGATLIVSLVILAVITILGVASMRASNLELRMAASARDRAVAFQAAESALARVEREIIPQFSITSVLPGCSAAECFNPDCDNGLCFTGDMEGANRDECSLANINGEVGQPWKITNYWDNAGRHKVMRVTSSRPTESGDDFVEVKYMIEFLCFVPASEDAIDDGENSRNSGVQLYRITVRAEGEARRSAVVLQSVYRGAR
jgi:Tfp pilus assembly protein PilX